MEVSSEDEPSELTDGASNLVGAFPAGLESSSVSNDDELWSPRISKGDTEQLDFVEIKYELEWTDFSVLFN